MPQRPPKFDRSPSHKAIPPDPVIAVEPGTEFERLEAEVASLEAGNRVLIERLLNGYTNLLRVLDQSDPLHAQAVVRTRELRNQLRQLAPEVTRVEVATPAADPVFTTLRADELFTELDRLQCLEYFNALPAKLQPDYLKRLQDLYTKPTEAVRITSLRAIIFEMSRIARVTQQGLESVDVTAIMDQVAINYNGYDKDETVFDAAHQKVVKTGSEIDFDVPISRDGKPYSYEVKSYSRKRYGQDAASRNQ